MTVYKFLNENKQPLQRVTTPADGMCLYTSLYYFFQNTEALKRFQFQNRDELKADMLLRLENFMLPAVNSEEYKEFGSGWENEWIALAFTEVVEDVRSKKKYQYKEVKKQTLFSTEVEPLEAHEFLKTKFNTPESFVHFYIQSRQELAWGGWVELSLAARSYSLKINIHNSINSTLTAVKNEQGACDATLDLHYNGSHYEPLAPVQEIANHCTTHTHAKWDSQLNPFLPVENIVTTPEIFKHLKMAVTEKNWFYLLSLLLQRISFGYDLTLRDQDGSSLSWYLIQLLEENIGIDIDKIVLSLLENGLPLLDGPCVNSTLLYNLFEGRQLKVLEQINPEKIIELDRRIRKDPSQQPLLLWMMQTHSDLALFLINHKSKKLVTAVMQRHEKDNSTPIHWAAENFLHHLIPPLCRHGIDPNAKCSNGSTPLALLKKQKLEFADEIGEHKKTIKVLEKCLEDRSLNVTTSSLFFSDRNEEKPCVDEPQGCQNSLPNEQFVFLLRQRYSSISDMDSLDVAVGMHNQDFYSDQDHQPLELKKVVTTPVIFEFLEIAEIVENFKMTALLLSLRAELKSQSSDISTFFNEDGGSLARFLEKLFSKVKGEDDTINKMLALFLEKRVPRFFPPKKKPRTMAHKGPVAS